MTRTPLRRYGPDNPNPCWSILNFPEITHWMGFDMTMALMNRRQGVLEAVLGPKTQTWVGGSGRNRHDVWLADAEGIPVWILRSVRGTVYEFEHPGSPWDGSIVQSDIDKVKRFLARLWLLGEEAMPLEKRFEPPERYSTDPIIAQAAAAIAAGRTLQDDSK